MIVALTFHTKGSERTIWDTMPAVPRIGDRLHAPEGVEGSWFTVISASWQESHPQIEGWFPEIGLSQ